MATTLSQASPDLHHDERCNCADQDRVLCSQASDYKLVFAQQHSVERKIEGQAQIAQAGECQMASGTVKWFNDAKGFGFITPDDGSADLFAHYSAIASSGFKSLQEGQKVTYEATKGPKGMQASNIQPV